MQTDFDSINIYELWLALKLSSPKRFSELIHKYGNARDIFDNIRTIKKGGENLITDAAYAAMCKEPPEKLCEKLRPTVMRLDIDVILKSNPMYPALLKQCIDSPDVLFVRGRLPSEESHTVGIVGTRSYTNYGAEMTDIYSYNIAKQGGVIVSGMALGVDTIAAKSALRASESECMTVAVLGSGIDVPTPVENERLYERIIRHGAVVSQFVPGVHATRYTYPMRNKIIAGLSEILIVTEAGEKSGALITAEAAFKYGRPVYCLPGRSSDKSYVGANKLLAEGRATYAPQANELYEEVFSGSDNKKSDFHAHDESQKKEKPQEKPIVKKQKRSTNLGSGLDEAGEKIYNALKQGEKSFDDLCAITDLDISQLNLKLTLMEISGIIIQLPGRIYKLH